MRETFRNRTEAGQLLAGKLTRYAHRHDVLVLGLPCGGVPVAYEVARVLEVPWDILVVRKLGVPGCRELAMGAVATGGVRVVNDDAIQEAGVSQLSIDAITAEAQKELGRRELAYRGQRRPPVVKGRTVILVDDGIATGSTMRAAIQAVRVQQPAQLVVAVPAAAPASCETIRQEVDEMVALLTPEGFYAVGQCYEDFRQVGEAEVTGYLAAPGRDTPRHEPAHHPRSL